MDTAFELTKQNLMYFTLIGAGAGLILGLIPLILAIRKSKMKLGLLAIVLSTIAGVTGIISIGIILPLIVIAIFIWIILKKSPAPKPDSSTDATDSTPS